MKEVNLEHITNDKVSTFSGGMKRRINNYIIYNLNGIGILN